MTARALLIGTLLAAPALGADPFAGTWVMNTAASSYMSGDLPQAMTIEVDVGERGEHYRSRTVRANRTLATAEYTADYDGRLAMVIGTPGGSRIFTSVFQVLADVYDFKLPLPKAMAALRFHHQLLPENTIFTEPYAPLPAPLAAAMRARGYRIEDQGFNGDMAAIQVVGGAPTPASDPRARGVSLVVP